jgi:hypothetical protein
MVNITRPNWESPSLILVWPSPFELRLDAANSPVNRAVNSAPAPAAVAAPPPDLNQLPILPAPALIIEAVLDKKVREGEAEGAGAGVATGADAVTGGRAPPAAAAGTAGIAGESGLEHFNTIDKPAAPRTDIVMPSITAWGPVRGSRSTKVGLTLPATGEITHPVPEGASLNCSLLKNLESA